MYEKYIFLYIISIYNIINIIYENKINIKNN